MPLESEYLRYAREADVKNKDNWEEYVKWCSDKVVLFHSVFSKYIKKINKLIKIKKKFKLKLCSLDIYF